VNLCRQFVVLFTSTCASRLQWLDSCMAKLDSALVRVITQGVQLESFHHRVLEVIKWRSIPVISIHRFVVSSLHLLLAICCKLTEQLLLNVNITIGKTSKSSPLGLMINGSLPKLQESVTKFRRRHLFLSQYLFACRWTLHLWQRQVHELLHSWKQARRWWVSAVICSIASQG
jgi:hypothetical protein